jgi:hypothetical protein
MPLQVRQIVHVVVDGLGRATMDVNIVRLGVNYKFW